LYAKNLLKLLH